jgi:hypothetical protein
MSFVPDDDIRQIAEAYALDAVDFARASFQAKLDWSDDSIQLLEAILQSFHEKLPDANPSDEQVMQFAKMFGSYIGEVYRRNHGATWGMVTLEGDTFPGLEAEGTGKKFWPWGRAQNRLTEGPENNVWHYYCVLIEGAPRKEPPAPKASWWRRLTGL